MTKLDVTRLEKITGELEEITDEIVNYTAIEYVQHHEDETGGTLIFQSDSYSIMLDYDLTGGYNYHVATTKYDNNGIMETEEKNQGFMKSTKAVINYIKRFNK